MTATRASPSGRAVARRVLLTLLAVLAAPLLAAAPAHAQSGLAGDVRGAQVLVLGVPGLRWSDVDTGRTPALQALSERAAVGVLSVKALPAVSCPADGWLTLGAGQRAQAFGVACGDLVGDEEDLARRNADSRDSAEVGALGTALQQRGACLSALGAGAQLAGGEPLPGASGANQGSGRAARACPALLLDAGIVSGSGSQRAAAAAGVDALVAAVDAARDDGSTLLVVGLSEASRDDEPSLQVALAAGPTFPAGALRSASTRRASYVQLVDVAPTVLELLDVPVPSSMVGEPWRSTEERPAAAALADLEQRAEQARAVQVPFFVALLAALLVALAAARVRRSWRAVELAGLAVVAAVGASYLVMLLPWWRAPSPLLALLAAVASGAAVAAVAADRVRGLVAPAGALCGALAVVLALDLLTGARLQIDAVAGYSPLVAGRFAGIGNVAFGVFAAAALLALAAATHQPRARQALTVVAVGGLAAVVLDGAPPFGSDVGGVLALVPALVLLAMLRTGTRVSVLRLLAAGVAGAAVVAGFALADWSRAPADRTHLGRFVDQVVDGTAGGVLRRKAEAVVDLLLANAATALLPLVLAAAVLLVVRPPASLRRAFEAAPAWRHGVYAVGAASAIGFAVNDSGPGVAALALLVAAPATLAVVARREQHEPPDR